MRRSPITFFASPCLSLSDSLDIPSLVVCTARQERSGSSTGSYATSATTPNCWDEMRSGGTVDDPTYNHQRFGGGLMAYSYTQISHYLTCPRRYRQRYLDGWQEKDTRAAMLFGRALEQALAGYVVPADAAAVAVRGRC